MKDRIDSSYEDLQDKLWSKHPDLFDSIYYSIKRSTGKEPTPTMMVRRFKDNYPTLYIEVSKNS